MKKSSYLGTYDELYLEYYDSDQHPTCDNFRQLSASFFSTVRSRPYFKRLDGLRVLETGAGKSVLLESGADRTMNIVNLSLQDQSEGMLSHSATFAATHVDTFVSDARVLPMGDASIDFVASFLCDPYNDEGLWRELHRVLDSNGIWLCTTPSADWSASFRNEEQRCSAEFVLKSGSIRFVPSMTYPPTQLVDQVSNIGFRLFESRGMFASELEGFISHKLLVDPSAPVVDCFVFSKTK